MRRFGLLLSFAFLIAAFPPGRAAADTLYFPHADVTAGWQTEICLVNTGTAAVVGSLAALADNGQAVGAPLQVDLGARERRVIDVATAFPGFGRGYLSFNSGSEAVVGYGEFSYQDEQRAAVPATASPSLGNLYLDHIDESAIWWTGVALVNTTDAVKSVAFRFANGVTRTILLAAHSHYARTVSQIYGGTPPASVAKGYAVIESEPGLVGIELFGQHPDAAHPERTAMDGIPLTSATQSELYVLDYQDNATWWTGIGIYNPGTGAADLLFIPYSSAGASLDGHYSGTAPAGGKYVCSSLDHAPNASTSWIRVRASRPVTGFFLLGEFSGRNLAGLLAVGDRTLAGVLPKIEPNEDTVFHLVNANAATATITYRAYDDDGLLRAEDVETLEPLGKRNCTPGSLFVGMDVSRATYVTFASDQPLLAFEYNHVSGRLLDTIPALPLPGQSQPAAAQLAALLGAAAAMADGPKVIDLTDFRAGSGSYSGRIEYTGRPGDLLAELQVTGDALGALDLTCRMRVVGESVLVDSLVPGLLDGREVTLAGLAFDPAAGFDAPLAGRIGLRDEAGEVGVRFGGK